ncbi:MAG TPA: hypothetical protein VGO62_17720 [Myxococcota bacterium]
MHHRHLLNLDEPWIEVPRAGQQDLLLQSAPATAIQERLRILEVFVTRYCGSGDFASFDGFAVERRDDADHIGLDPLQY